MTIYELLKNNQMTMYGLSKKSMIPYATVRDICTGKTRLEKCSAETIYKIAHAMNVSMEELLAPCFLARSNFENYKSSVCHRVKELGEIPFIIDTLENKMIRLYYERKWYPESLYLLAMLDYLSRENGIPLDVEYDDIRQCRLEKPVYPASLRVLSMAFHDDDILREAEKTAIPEFMRFNIVENEVK